MCLGPHWQPSRTIDEDSAREIREIFDTNFNQFMSDVWKASEEGRELTESQINAIVAISKTLGSQLAALFSGSDANAASRRAQSGRTQLEGHGDFMLAFIAECWNLFAGVDEDQAVMEDWASRSIGYAYAHDAFYRGVIEALRR